MDKNFIDPKDGLPRINLKNPIESVESFLDKLREISVKEISNTKDITTLDWPYKIVPK